MKAIYPAFTALILVLSFIPVFPQTSGNVPEYEHPLNYLSTEQASDNSDSLKNYINDAVWYRELDEAKKVALSYNRNHPKDTAGYWAMAEAYSVTHFRSIDSTKLLKAIQYLDTAIQLNPRSGYLHRKRGIVKEKMGLAYTLYSESRLRWLKIAEIDFIVAHLIDPKGGHLYFHQKNAKEISTIECALAKQKRKARKKGKYSPADRKF